MKPEPAAWQQLVTAARQLRDDRDAAAPYGFATRVVALAFQHERKSSLEALFERFSWRALGLAGLLALVGAASTYASAHTQTDDDAYLDDSAEVQVLGFSGS